MQGIRSKLLLLREVLLAMAVVLAGYLPIVWLYRLGRFTQAGFPSYSHHTHHAWFPLLLLGRVAMGGQVLMISAMLLVVPGGLGFLLYRSGRSVFRSVKVSFSPE